MMNPAVERKLGRSDLPIAPILWEIGALSNLALLPLIAQPHTLIVMDSASPAPLGPGLSLVIRVEAGQLVRRDAEPLVQALRRCGVDQAAAILLRSNSAGLKGGRPLHRLQQWRDAGLARLLLLEAPTYEDAEWMTEHTPAHGVVLPFDLENQSAEYRLARSARELGVALIARPSQSTPEQVAFIKACESITAMLLPLPGDVAECQLLQNISPITLEQRQANWLDYQQTHPQPPSPRTSHPPEYGT